MDASPKETSISKPTPVNWLVVLVSFTIMVASASTISVVFPFLPWLVRKFKRDGEFVQEEDAGYYAGLVASAFFIGRFVGSYFWGTLSDTKGRRWSILLSGTLLSSFTFTFAFTNTQTGLAWAMVTRILSGASEGEYRDLGHLQGDCRRHFGRYESSERDVVCLGFVGRWSHIFGSAIGGLLAEPVRQLLETFPYFLPSALVAFLNLIGVAIVFFFLPETSKRKKKKKKRDLSAKKDDDVALVVMDTNEVTRESVADDPETEPVVLVSAKNGVWTRFMNLGKRARRASANAVKKLKATVIALLRVKEARLAVATYCVYSFSVIGFSELTSLWMATKPFRGGLGFSEKEIGICQAVMSVFLVPVQIPFTYKVERKLGPLTTFYVCCVVCVCSVALLSAIPSIESVVLLWTILVIVLFPMRLFIGVGFAMISILINNSVPKRQVGSINGLSISLTALTRSFAPTFGGSIFCLVHQPRND
ncbi:uncharacterized protein [Oscarella lobularis]|uniref:uncharacterized protein n=1 Tax=Oscarella lobularis TaxID=121494 RepID=UPI0033143799